MSQLSAANPEAGKLRYDNLDGLRAYAAIGIVLMHVLGNGRYELDGILFDKLIPSFADLVFVFMVISGFAMCCGYYDKVVSGQMDMGKFYAKRFAKAWPFFAVLCLVDFAMAPTMHTFYELLANLTLCFGLFPNGHITVIGVGWFLGLAFVFYFMFPFFCTLLSDKKRAWVALAVALLLSLLTTVRFGGERYHLGYSGVFFLAGGLIYVYREPLRRFVDKFGWLLAIMIAVALMLYYLLPNTALTQLPISCLLALIGLRTLRRKNTLLYNPVTRMLSGISMEIYLCHMMVFRILEKLKLVRLFQSELLSFVVATVATIAGSVVLALVFNKAMSLLGKLLNKKTKTA